MHRPARRLFSVVLLLGLLFPFGAAQAQANIRAVDITGVGYADFPDVAVQVRVLDARGVPVTLADNDLVVTENGQPVTIHHREQIYVGLQLALVIDAGAGIDHDDNGRETRAQLIQQAAKRYIETMQAGDATEIVVVTADETRVAFGPSSNKDELRNAIDQLSLVTAYNVDVNGERIIRLSRGLDGVERALVDLKQSTNSQQARAVLFFSSGIQRDANRLAEYERVERIAQEAQPPIPLHVVGVGRSDALDSLIHLASTTFGFAISLENEASLDDLYAQLAAQREQYLLVYRTHQPDSGERVVTVAANGAAEASLNDGFQFAVQPAPLPPTLSSFGVNNGDPIRRTAETHDDDRAGLPQTEAQITAEIAWDDGYPRQIKSAELLIDGQPHGNPQFDPGANLSFRWDLRQFTTEGTTTAIVQVRIEDELGFVTTSPPFAAPVEVMIPPAPPPPPEPEPCADLSGWRDFLCQRQSWLTAVPGYAALALAVPTLGLAILAYRFRGQIGEVGARVVEVATDPLRQRHRKEKPLAYLAVRRGLELGRRYKIYRGITPVGRSRKFANPRKGAILLKEHEFIEESPISRLHCTIAEENDEFTLTDNGSKNGTWVNGSELKAEEPHRLQDGDIIELAAENEDEPREIEFEFKRATGLEEDGEGTEPTR